MDIFLKKRAPPLNIVTEKLKVQSVSVDGRHSEEKDDELGGERARSKSWQQTDARRRRGSAEPHFAFANFSLPHLSHLTSHSQRFCRYDGCGLSA